MYKKYEILKLLDSFCRFVFTNDKGNKPKRVCPPTDEEINILYNRNVLGSYTPQFLLNTLMSYMVK
jgi:hypothetical protein